MSTVNRAFIRAYSKEVPVLEPAPHHESEAIAAGVSPYAPLPVTRKPQSKYRVETSLTPWGSGGSALSVAQAAPLSLEMEPAPPTYLESVNPQPFVLSTSKPVAATPHAVTPLVLKPEPVAEVKTNLAMQPIAETKPDPIAVKWEPITNFAQLPAAQALSVGEYLCISGTSMTPDVHLALMPPAVEFIDLIGTREIEQPVAKSYPKPVEIKPTEPVSQPPKIEVTVHKPAIIEATVNTPPVIEVKLHDNYEYKMPVAPQVAPASTDFLYPPAPPVEEAKRVVTPELPKAEPETQSTTKPEMEVLWEVDRYLFPPMTDRLLRSYAYFSQAGEKLKHAAEAGLKILAVTGIARGEGRTTLAICLARAAAQAGMRVGLFDCDFANPTLAMSLGLEIDHGWRHLLTGKVSLQEIAIRSVDEGITLFPLTAKDANSGLRLLDARVGKIIHESAEYVDLLILDLGPWSEMNLSTESPLPFDAAIVVRDCRHHALDDVQPTAKLLQNAGVEAVGIAENFTAVR